MPLTSAQLAQYCRRIGYAGPVTPTLATLRALHLHHPLAITFENGDSWLGLPPRLDDEALFDKLVIRQRGGYCFEQNGLLELVLETLGFSVRGLSARVLWNLPDDAQPPRTHKALLVEIQGLEWLVDVGFGGLTPLGPVRLTPEIQQATPLETLRLRQRGSGFLLEALLPSGPKPMYWFLPEPAAPADFIQSNWFVATHPDSRFLRHFITTCVRLEPDRTFTRHNLIDRDYSVYRTGQAPVTRTLRSVGEAQQLLRDVFTLPVDSLPSLTTRMHGWFQEQP